MPCFTINVEATKYTIVFSTMYTTIHCVANTLYYLLVCIHYIANTKYTTVFSTVYTTIHCVANTLYYLLVCIHYIANTKYTTVFSTVYTTIHCVANTLYYSLISIHYIANSKHTIPCYKYRRQYTYYKHRRPSLATRPPITPKPNESAGYL